MALKRNLVGMATGKSKFETGREMVSIYTIRDGAMGFSNAKSLKRKKERENNCKGPSTQGDLTLSILELVH